MDSKSLFPVRTLVRLAPEWADGDTQTYRVVGADESKGRVDISPVEWAHGLIPPVETVRTEMVRRA